MKKLLIIIAGVVLSVSVFAANVKIGVIDVQKILHNAPQVTALQAKLKKQFAPEQQKLIGAQKQLMADVKKLNRNGSVMKAADKKALTDKIAKEQQQFQKMQIAFQKNLTVAQHGAMKTVLDSIKSAVSKVAKKGHYTLILTKAALAYYVADYDVTSQVINQLK